MFDFFPSRKTEPIETFTELLLRISGMRGSVEYEIACLGDQSRLTFFEIRYADGEESRNPAGQTCLPTSEVLGAFSLHGAAGWDGFHGSHPRGVLDGEQFSLAIRDGDDVLVHADGSANFPKGFRDFRRWLDEVLSAAR